MVALISRIRRRISRHLKIEPVFPVDEVETRYLDGDVAALVRGRMLTGEPKGERDGDRSVRLPHPNKPGHDIKIKGAGLFTGQVQFDRRHHSGLKAPIFDFEGRMMEDVASGHDAAWLGGASFQQAVTEYRMARLLADKGYQVLPCLGYGRIRHKHRVSWFSVHEPQSEWIAYALPKFTLEEYVTDMEALGRIELDLAIKHHIVGYLSCIKRPGGPKVLKDFHPLRQADPINMSQISWVMQVFFGLHVQTLAALYFARKEQPERVPGDDVQLARLRAVAPAATVADHEALRLNLVAPYMRGPPASFDPTALVAVLEGNPITRALLEVCPEAYARY